MLRLYSQADSIACDQARRYMRRKGYRFRELSIDEEPELVEDILLMTDQKDVPMITNGRTFIVGFFPASIDKMVQDLRKKPEPVEEEEAEEEADEPHLGFEP